MHTDYSLWLACHASPVCFCIVWILYLRIFYLGYNKEKIWQDPVKRYTQWQNPRNMEFRPQLCRKARTLLERNSSPLWYQWIPLRGPNSANVHKALLREMITCEAHSHRRRGLKLMMAHKLLPSYLLVRDGHFPRHGTILSPIDWWWDGAGKRKALRSCSCDFRRWGNTFSLITVKSSSALNAAGFRMSCFPGVIYLMLCHW